MELKNEQVIDDLNSGLVDSEGTIVEGEDYKTKSIRIYKNSIAHYDVLIANLTAQANNPTITEELKADYTNQLVDAKARRDEVQTSLNILEKGGN